MTITVMEASNYFKGLLLLIRKDRAIAQTEINFIRRIGKILGFEKEFCDNAIDEILENTYIVDEPPSFAANELATKFVRDGLSLAFADGEIHPHEEQWLRSTAERNGLTLKVFLQERDNARNSKGYLGRLEAEDLIVEHS